MNKRVILITGGSQGLGKETARTLAKDTNNLVIIVSNDENNLNKTSKELNLPSLICDVSNPTSVKETVANVLKEFEKIDVLINNAGIMLDGSLDSYPPEIIEKTFGVNTLGTIYFSQAVLATMKAKKAGTILNVVSYAGLVGRENRSIYNSSKWAITGFTESIRKELRPFGISVLGIYPNLIKTNLFSNAGLDHDMSSGMEPADVAKVIEFMLSFKNLQMAQVVVGNLNYQF